MARPATLLILTLLSASFAGCIGSESGTNPGATSGGTGSGGKDTDAPVAFAPWWHEGDYWTLTYDRENRGAKTVKLAVFLNDSREIDPGHFWLGVPDRTQALDHALYDTNPFLGRIHWVVLAPHEKGMHAVMYTWPLEDGKTWLGSLFGGDWQFKASAIPWREGAFEILGEGADGSRIAYDYDPDAKWFTHLQITDANGRKTLTAEVTDHGDGAKGTYHFIRGRDYYAGPNLRSGTHNEEFTVQDEGVTSLAFRVDLATSAPLEIQLLNPRGEIAQREASTGGKLDRTFEIPDPTPGRWQVRYVTAGSMEGTVLGTGLIEYKRTV